jgi:hypothetical protein
MNQAFLFSFFLATAMALAVIPYAKRRPADKKGSWGEAMLGSTYAFAALFIAFGVVPHQWIDHADKDLGWTRANLIYGPFDILKPTSAGGSFPISIGYEALRDIIVILIHVYYFALLLILWKVWQGRGEKQAGTDVVATSHYGRPLVRKG